MLDFLASVTGAALVAIFSWWLGTGAILWLVRLPAHRFKRSMLALTLLTGLSLLGTAWSMRYNTMAAAYAGFISVIVMWGWHEMAFLSGWITGPRRIAQEPGVRGWQRFNQALQTLLHHEIGLLINFALLFAMQHGHPNHVALCTFALLWCMRVSAKLNLFFGVPHVGDQYLPIHFLYLASYFRRSSVTGCFFLTISLSAGTWIWLVAEAQRSAIELSTGWVLLASLLGLAIVEHLLMVFALPLQRLWGWALQRGQQLQIPDSERGVLPPAMPTALPTHPDRV
jgi:putative photosynthetic complex assembly protein 2